MHALMPAAFLLVFSAPALALPSPCQPAPLLSQVRLGADKGQHASFAGDRRLGQVSIDRRHLSWRQGARDDRVTLGYGHEYSIMAMQGLSRREAGQYRRVRRAGNGHLHALYVPVDLSALLRQGWQLRLQPTLAVSSSLLKHPGKIDAKAFQFNAALLRRWRQGPAAGWYAGLCADYRFGDYRAYPSLGWEGEAGAFSARLGYPDAELSLRLSEALSSGVRVSPAGNRWYLHDPELGGSIYRHEAWRAQWYLEWKSGGSWGAALHAGQLLHSRHEFRLRDGAALARDGGSPLQVGFTLIWQYR